MPIPTPDTVPGGVFAQILLVPADREYVRLVKGALLELAEPATFEQITGATPEEVAFLFGQMVDSWSMSSTMIGTVFPYATQNPPIHCLPCDGTVYARNDYPELYAVLDPVFIVGADNFEVPDLRDVTIIGASATHPVNETGGAENVTLDLTQIPSHNHPDLGHVHVIGSSVTGLVVAPGELPVSVPSIPTTTGSASANNQSAGGGLAHNNMQPYRALKYCIWAR